MNKDEIQGAIDKLPTYLPVSQIEKKLGMPPTTLQKVLSGGRELPKRWVKPLNEFFGSEIQDLTAPTLEIKPVEQPKSNFIVVVPQKEEISQERAEIESRIKVLEGEIAKGAPSTFSSIGKKAYIFDREKELKELKNQL